MKKLTRIRLINWHRFMDATVDIGESMLISGENGSGKSTLLDAIQFVITCSSNNFNKAAHENGKRKLTGYIRCKTGKENRPYERTGEISAHVALEFFEEKSRKFFIVGTVIDSSSENQEKWVRYIINGCTLDELVFTDDDTPLSITQFRTVNKRVITNWCKTDKDAKTAICNRFGRIEDKFFSLIPKALAFRPIDDIKNFVYSYVLDEKEVNIDALRENVRTYQELEKTLENVRIRISRLERINEYHSNVADGLAKDRQYDFYLSCIACEITEGIIEELEKKVEKDKNRLSQAEIKRKSIISEKADSQELRDNIRTELASDLDFIALDEQRKHLAFLKQEEGNLLLDEEKLTGSLKLLKREHRKYDSLLDKPDSFLAIYDNVLSKINETEDIASIKESVSEAIAYKRKTAEDLKKKCVEEDIKIDRLSAEKAELQRKIEKLRKRQLSYPESVNRLMDGIKEDFAAIGKRNGPKVLCETLEITDENWRNAVEGYLNTQRFYVMVEPDDFDVALGTYDKLRREKKAYGAGLINAGKLEEYDEAKEGSLATVVKSGDRNAKRYINMILGKVRMCENYNELKKYPTSVTRECMKYSNRVASAIKPEIYRTPYIGSNAFRVQLSQAEEKYEILKKDISEITAEIESMNMRIRCLDTAEDTEILYRIESLQKLRICRKGIKACEENISNLEKNSNLMMKQMQLEEIEKVIRKLEAEADNLTRQLGGIETEIERDCMEIEVRKNELVSQKAACRETEKEAGEDLQVWIREYEKQKKGREQEVFRRNFEQQKKRNITKTENAESEMEKAMVEYKTAHDFGAAASLEGYPYFEAEYRKLSESELLSYEEKVKNARGTAEIEFREQFLSKLQENIKQAQSEFRGLNNALKDITFSSERYEFTFGQSKVYSEYYNMIMSDFNAVYGESLLSGHFHDEHKEVIDELFDRLALDKENSLKSLDEFTDYRTYMDYDIKILHGDGTISMYSKVCEEKSGGETQTPFYVTVAASFVQLYNRNIGGEAIGLVMFDEAFNNMDDERMGGVLEFMNRLNLQIIIAAPPEKIQYISPYMAETALVMTDNKISFIEVYKKTAENSGISENPA